MGGDRISVNFAIEKDKVCFNDGREYSVHDCLYDQKCRVSPTERLAIQALVTHSNRPPSITDYVSADDVYDDFDRRGASPTNVASRQTVFEIARQRQMIANTNGVVVANSMNEVVRTPVNGTPAPAQVPMQGQGPGQVMQQGGAAPQGPMMADPDVYHVPTVGRRNRQYTPAYVGGGAAQGGQQVQMQQGGQPGPTQMEAMTGALQGNSKNMALLRNESVQDANADEHMHHLTEKANRDELSTGLMESRLLDRRIGNARNGLRLIDQAGDVFGIGGHSNNSNDHHSDHHSGGGHRYGNRGSGKHSNDRSREHGGGILQGLRGDQKKSNERSMNLGHGRDAIKVPRGVPHAKHAPDLKHMPGLGKHGTDLKHGKPHGFDMKHLPGLEKGNHHNGGLGKLTKGHKGKLPF